MMRSRVSFFSMHILKKDLTRFTPVWGIYTVILFLNLVFGGAPPTGNPLSAINKSMMWLWYNTFLYAGVCGLCLFADLYNFHRSTGLHALPVSRGCWFWTHAVAGIIFALIPYTVFSVFLSSCLEQYWYLAFVWLGAAMLQFLTFFGAAVFCAVCAGSKMGMCICYVGVNFWLLLVYGVIDALYTPLLYGIITDNTVFMQLLPVAQFSVFEYVGTSWDNATQRYLFTGIKWADFGMTAAFVGMAVLLLAGAFWLYRRRKLEAAGSFMALKPAAAVLQVLMALLAAFALGSLAGVAMGFVGLIPGFFAGKMITDKTVDVFHKRSLKGAALLCGVMLAALAVTAMDPAGLHTWVPEPSQVQQVNVSEWCDHGTYGHEGAPFISAREQEEIEMATWLQKQIIKEKKQADGAKLHFRYKMKDGSEVERLYPVSTLDAKQHCERWEEAS